MSGQLNPAAPDYQLARLLGVEGPQTQRITVTDAPVSTGGPVVPPPGVDTIAIDPDDPELAIYTTTFSLDTSDDTALLPISSLLISDLSDPYLVVAPTLVGA